MKANLQEVTQIMNFQAAVFQNIIQDPEKLNVQSLDGTHQTLNIDFIRMAKGLFSFTSVANIRLARHFLHTVPTHATIFNHNSLLTVMIYTTHRTDIHIQYSLSAPVSHTMWHTPVRTSTLFIISAVYQLTNDTITNNLSKSHSPFLWHCSL
jgi:hypothetical protein